jgi:hypothetical protein
MKTAAKVGDPYHHREVVAIDIPAGLVLVRGNDIGYNHRGEPVETWKLEECDIAERPDEPAPLIVPILTPVPMMAREASSFGEAFEVTIATWIFRGGAWSGARADLGLTPTGMLFDKYHLFERS